jgi:L-2,4-diaminobutyrate decarboxylase
MTGFDGGRTDAPAVRSVQSVRAGLAGLAGGPGGAARLRSLVGTALDALAAGRAARAGPLPSGGPGPVAHRVRAALGGGTHPPAADRAREPGAGLLPDEGMGSHQALAALTRMLAHGTADPADPACAGHLHCPPLAVAVAADLAVSALNPSLDSWDQAPAATEVETELVGALARLVDFDPATAGGAVTSGGSESNLTAILLARERCPAGRRPVVFCSRAAHFSIARSAAVLGIPTDAVVGVDVDDAGRMDPAELRAALRKAGSGAFPVVVATAGTTDTGAVDPLPDVAAELAATATALGGQAPAGDRPSAGERAWWLHVDAAYGGGALLSARLRPLLDGVATADSVALDLHKLGWQPVPAGVLLTRDATAWAPLEATVAYLNPEDDTDAGYPSLLGRSLRTTRRADCFPIAVTLLALGRRRLGAMVDACHDLALHAGRRVAAHPRLELAAPVTLTTVAFRYLPSPAARHSDADAVNAELRRRLLAAGEAVVGRAELGPERAVCLKLTLLNPDALAMDVDVLLDLVVQAGLAVEAGTPAETGPRPEPR